MEPTRDAGRDAEKKYTGKANPDSPKQILEAAGVPYFNRSKYSFSGMRKVQAGIKEGRLAERFLRQHEGDPVQLLRLGGESLSPIYETFARKNFLYLITKEFSNIDLHPNVVDNHEMGMVYEHLIRKFTEWAAAGEQYTPRVVVYLIE